MKSNLIKLSICLLVITVIGLSVLLFKKNNSTSSKQAFVISNILFQSFDGTKSLKNKVQVKETYYRSILDSLKLEISLMQENPNPQMKVRQLNLEKSYKTYYDQMMQYNNEYISSEERKIWTQLNQYVNEYGKSNDYKYIYGANGNGSIMYADSTLDITQQIIEFSNKKYSGQ